MATTKKTGSSSRPRKSTTSKSTTSKSTTSKSASSGTSKQSEGATKKAAPRRRTSSSAPRATAPKKKSGMTVAREAAQQLLELTGKAAEGVTGFERSDDGWRVEVEVVEVRRIPDTADILALYELSVDEDGELEGYRRLRRYSRGSTGQESG
jgi:gas vesicle protein GvpO